MEVIAQSNYLRISPRKLRLVVSAIDKLAVSEALDKLRFVNKKGGEIVLAVLHQAIGNAKNNFKLNPENLIIKEILVDEGPRLKRMDKSHGARFNRGLKQKRLCHLKIFLKEKIAEKKEKTAVKNKK